MYLVVILKIYFSTIQDSSASGASTKSASEKYSTVPSQSSTAPSNDIDDDFDDFDPRGTSNASKFSTMMSTCDAVIHSPIWL